MHGVNPVSCPRRPSLGTNPGIDTGGNRLCEKSLVTINKYLLQTSVKFSNKAEQGGGYGRLEIC